MDVMQLFAALAVVARLEMGTNLAPRAYSRIVSRGTRRLFGSMRILLNSSTQWSIGSDRLAAAGCTLLSSLSDDSAPSVQVAVGARVSATGAAAAGARELGGLGAHCSAASSSASRSPSSSLIVGVGWVRR
eukprot:scaffold140523_cov30-Tisochrysis_lutea.AAC.1